ncbi:hypothetical protein ACSBR2_015074 [Camellia fascicularis]
MRYTVSDLYTTMGRHWVPNDDFEYSLNPNFHYTMATMNTIRAEQIFFKSYVKKRIFKFLKKRSKNMSIDTPQSLQRALHCIHEEVNRMSTRLNRCHFRQLATKNIDDGLMHEVEFYLNASRKKTSII